MKTLKLLTATIFLLPVSVCGQAQQLEKPNEKFGKPTKEELTMVRYDKSFG